MDVQEFLANFETIAEAPGGVANLRRLVVDLAIRGNLTADFSTIAAHDDFVESSEAHTAQYFPLKAGWTWQQIGKVATLENGDRGKNYPAKESLVESGVPFINAGHLQSGTIALDCMNFITLEHFNRLNSGKTKEGDVLFCLRGSLGKTGIVTGIEHAAIASSLVIVRPRHDLLPKFLQLYFFSSIAKEMIRGYDNGTAQPNLSSADLRKFLIPLPPLAEQHRIVTRVNELMALCDQLEERQAKRDSIRKAMQASVFGALANAREADDLVRSWDRTENGWSTLLCKIQSVQGLREAALQLAVTGRLSSGKPSNPQAIERQTNPAVSLPEGWDWKPISELLVEDTRNGIAAHPNQDPPGIDILRISAGTSRRDAVVNEGDCRFLPVAPETVSEYILKKGDLLACRFNGNLHYVGKFSVYEAYSGRKQVFPDKLIRFRLSLDNANPWYVRYAMNSVLVRNSVEQLCATTAGNIGLSATKLKTVALPVPPIAEQHRIVAKVNELMALCDQLEAGLKRQEETAAALAAAMCQAVIDGAGASADSEPSTDLEVAGPRPS